MPLAEYTFAFHRGSPEPAFVQSLSFESDAEAISEAGDLLRTQAEMVREPVTAICVARGAGDEAIWLGAWDANEGAVSWHPDE